MTIDQDSWDEARRTVRRGLRSSLHCSIASINDDGSAHVSPIGSVILTSPTKGMYFDVFAGRLSRNIDRDPRITVLAVDSSIKFWLRSLAKGRFAASPGIRLIGTAGPRRPATEQEAQRFRQAVRPLRHLKGHDLLWANMGSVRDLDFESIRPIRLGAMTGRSPGVRPEIAMASSLETGSAL